MTTAARRSINGGAVPGMREHAPMADIVLLGIGAAVFPTLIACTAIMISRPEPRRLLLAFYAGGMIVSITAGFVVLAVFNRGDAVLGNTVSGVHPGTSI